MVSDKYRQVLLLLVLMGSLESCPTGVIEIDNGKWSIYTQTLLLLVLMGSLESCPTGVIEIDNI